MKANPLIPALGKAISFLNLQSDYKLITKDYI